MEQVDLLIDMMDANRSVRETSFEALKGLWTENLLMPLIEVAYLHPDPVFTAEIVHFLQKNSGRYFGNDFNKWHQWIWNRNIKNIEGYPEFKARLYARLDDRFSRYFEGRRNSKIRMDEIRWGGVIQDGIPPLRNPQMLAAQEATYLADDDVVFGIAVNGDVRAYPKRILAWHELFTDQVGGIAVAGVYCTLCGTVILYKTRVNGQLHELGTSGFLYRSNKLMYDQATQSLWSTMRGQPVVGPLVDQGITMEILSVVTTTWGQWRVRHPDTKVLSLNTDHVRDYREGIAYKDYFSDDELMFSTPYKDRRLRNKQEVLALRFLEAPELQLAISTRFLLKNTLYQDKLGKVSFVVLTDQSGANRVYGSKEVVFKSYDGQYTLKDEQGNTWNLTEDLLKSDDGKALARLPYHRSFWFGWHAAFPETKLIK